jgi:hypothetical protein
MQKLVLHTGSFRNDDKLIAATVKEFGVTVEEATRALEDEKKQEQIWVNEKYQVAVRRFNHEKFGLCLQINIRRRDGNVIFRDWREFQKIKNQLADPEFEAIEIYPAESRLVDTSNKYQLWVICDRNFRWPFGWTSRDVRDENKESPPGMKQRKLPPGWKAGSDSKGLYQPAHHDQPTDC